MSLIIIEIYIIHLMNTYYFNQAKKIINSTNNYSPSLLQVNLKISYNEAVELIEQIKAEESASSTQLSSSSFSFDTLDGHSFEYFCAEILKYNGYSNIKVTSGSGDFGVDILCCKNGQKYAIQCK